MKKSIAYSFLLIFNLFFAISTFASGKEELHYVVSYKWGLIQKAAGDAVYTIVDKGDHFDLKMTGTTRPWADKVFFVRDTLMGTISKASNRPLTYIKSSHEKGKYVRDVIHYNYSGSSVSGEAVRTKQNKNGELETEKKILEANGDVFDMLSIYYYLRTVDFSKLVNGGTVKVHMFSGSKVEELTVRCEGKEKFTLNDKTQTEAYHLKFSFTTQGKKKSSDDIETWVAVSTPHIPYLIVGNLPIGQVRATLVSSK